nr:hypothetical protein [Pandoravirus aubagnensis]
MSLTKGARSPRSDRRRMRIPPCLGLGALAVDVSRSKFAFFFSPAEGDESSTGYLARPPTGQCAVFSRFFFPGDCAARICPPPFFWEGESSCILCLLPIGVPRLPGARL